MPLQELTRELVEAIARRHPTLQTLTLARNTLTELRFLELLPPLRRLDLSANRLRSLPAETAQWGRSLQFLDLSDNALESLQQLRACTELETLRVGGNRVALFSELKFLQPLERLADLTLEGNPIAMQPPYRREVVAMLPQLQRLDGRPITQAERLVASLQQKPQLTIATAPEVFATESAIAERNENGGEALLALDLSGASHAWSRVSQLSAFGGPRSPSVSPSSAASLSHSSPRRPLLTPATLQSATPQTTRKPSRQAADVSVHVAPSVAADDEEMMVVTRRTGAVAKMASPPLPPPDKPVALLQSRVSALESVLSLQDMMLQDELAELGKQQQVSYPVRAARVYTKLLGTWRHKVVALMVQLQSMELQAPPRTRKGQETVAAAEVARIKDELGRQLELWKQKTVDALAQRDIERVRVEQAQRKCEGAEGKIVKVVRTLEVERSRVRTIAEDVALFSAKDGVVTTQMDSLAQATHRVAAYETRLRLLSERLRLAGQLIAHREARLRNSEAAIEAERRVWSHKVAANAESGHAQRDTSRQKAGNGKSSPLLLRPSTEQALRMLFHRLDPYHTGLVSTRRFLDALRVDAGVSDAMGGAAAGELKRAKLVEHVEKQIRERSSSGSVSGNVTWGELLLVFMPAITDDCDDDDSRRLMVDDLGVPPRFDDTDDAQATQAPRQKLLQSRGDKQALHALSKHELVSQVLALRSDRDELQRRLLEDAQRLEQRVRWVGKQWGQKVSQLVSSNDDLHRQLTKQTQRAGELDKKLIEAERTAAEAQHQLQALRRQLSEQTHEFSKEKSELEAQRIESVGREQQVWQRELQDMAFQQTQLQAENAKLELSVRQLERELAKQRDQREQTESVRVQHLEDKVRKRDDDIVKLRRERNTILNALREHERKLAQQAAEKAAVHTESAATQTTAQQAPPKAAERSIGVQVSTITHTPSSQADRRMPLDEFDHEAKRSAPPPPPPPFPPPQGPPPSTQTSGVSPNELHKRLRQLESLTESLLAD